MDGQAVHGVQVAKVLTRARPQHWSRVVLVAHQSIVSGVVFAFVSFLLWHVFPNPRKSIKLSKNVNVRCSLPFARDGLNPSCGLCGPGNAEETRGEERSAIGGDKTRTTRRDDRSIGAVVKTKT